MTHNNHNQVTNHIRPEMIKFWQGILVALIGIIPAILTFTITSIGTTSGKCLDSLGTEQQKFA